MLPTSTLSRLSLLGLTVGAAWIIGCGGDQGTEVTPPPPPPPSLTITSLNPASAFRDVTVDVHVLGTGFAQGFRAVWARGTDTTFATTKVKTNSTAFVSATELVASITIQADAGFGSYSVKVFAADGRSAGPQSFAVNPNIETIDLGAGDNSKAGGINNSGKIVGARGANLNTVQAFLWDNGTITNLGVLPGMTFSYAADINESGQVVGVSGTGTIDQPIVERGFIWTAAGGMQALGTLGGISSAGAINDSGYIAGWSTVSGNNTQEGHAVFWRNGVITDLQPAPFANDVGRANAINASGEMVGWNYSRLQAYHWTQAGVSTAIAGGLPFGLNDAGCIAGWRTPGGVAVGYRSCAGVSRDVGSCGGATSRAWAINSAGDVVGDASNGSGQQVAFFWTESGGIICFPLPQGADGARAGGINNLGWVAGHVTRTVGGDHATLWKVK